MFKRIIITKYNNDFYKVKELSLTYKSKFKNIKHFNDKKLYNNVIRAKNKVFELALCNNFKYFVTITVNNKNNRYDLNWLVHTTSQIIRDCRKKYGGCWKYVLLPEKHKNGAWHMHGLFDDSFTSDFYINDNLYISWASYDKIGYSSISIIDNYLATCKYITKYVTKHSFDIEKGKRLYFCSQNLNRSIKDSEFIVTENFDLLYKKEFRFCKLNELNNDEVENLKNNILYNSTYTIM